MKTIPPAIRAATLAVVLLTVVLSGAVGFSGTARASLSTATAEDVLTGLDGTSQSVSVAGQSTVNGGTDYYTIDVTDIIRTGAELESIRFTNTGRDDDALAKNWTPQYHRENRTITFAVTEDAGDVDKKVGFDIVLVLDTTGAIAQDERRYTVTQYDTAGFDNRMSPQAAQFKLIGSNVLVATTSDEDAGAAPVFHNATLTMPTRERGVTYLTVNTSGANYGGLTHENITVRRNDGPDLVTESEPAVGSAGSSLLIPLDSTTNFRVEDDVSLVIGGARNPANTSMLTLSFRTSPSEPVFATSDEIEIKVECAEDTSLGSTSSGGLGAAEAGSIGALLGAGALSLGRRLFG